MNKRNGTLVCWTPYVVVTAVEGMGGGIRRLCTALDCSHLMTAREDLNLQDEERGKTFVHVALSGYQAR